MSSPTSVSLSVIGVSRKLPIDQPNKSRGGAAWARGTVRSCKGLYNLYFSERWGGQPSYPRGNDQLDATVRSTVSLQGGKSKRSFFLGLHTAAKLVGRPHS